MIITISGKPGSGKTTLAKSLAKKLGYKHYSTGDLMREIAEDRGMTLLELSKVAENDHSVDKALDERQIQLGKEEDRFVIDGRLAFHFIPKSVKIFCDIDIDVASQRVFDDQRKREIENISLSATKKAMKRRIISEETRFEKYYGLDIYDLKHYDLVIDTTDTQHDEVLEKVISFIEKLS